MVVSDWILIAYESVKILKRIESEKVRRDPSIVFKRVDFLSYLGSY